ncbi:MAG: hypothetical protein ACRDJE_29235 [Dehalococcoidia bacterium]
MRSENRKQQEDAAVELFGVADERSGFERTARDRADGPQTAGVWTFVVSVTSSTIILTPGYGC